ncbi:MAG TPA: hypothetical protein VGN34_13720, partial [Ktedonobacteraceae bacterium]
NRTRMDEQAWLHKSAETLTEITVWRRAHPQATFVEIEDEVHRRMMQKVLWYLKGKTCTLCSITFPATSFSFSLHQDH